MTNTKKARDRAPDHGPKRKAEQVAPDGTTSSDGLTSIKVSLFDGAKNPEPQRGISLSRICKTLVHKSSEDKIIELRDLIDEHGAESDEVKDFKKELPGVTFSGRFAYRRPEMITVHSGLICIDFDDVEDPEELKVRLSCDPSVVLAFISPSGTGVKAVFRVPDGLDMGGHKRAVDALFRHVQDVYDIEPDKGCRDISRLCFLSYDPDYIFNPEAVPFDISVYAESSDETPAAGPNYPPPSEDEIRTVLEHFSGERPEYDTWIRIISGVLDATGGEVEQAAALLCDFIPEEKPGEYIEKLRSSLDRVTWGTVVHLAKERGYRPPSRESDEPKKTQRELLIECLDHCELFRTPDGEMYSAIHFNDVLQYWPIGSERFKYWLLNECHVRAGIMPGWDAVDDVCNDARSRAVLFGAEIPVHLRVHSDNQCVGLDLADDRWRDAIVDKSGWRLVDSSDPLFRFRRNKRSGSLPEPEIGGSLELFKKHIRFNSDDDYVLVCAWMIFAMLGRGPFPVLAVTGEHGTAKTSAMRVIRDLIDPQSLRDPEGPPRDSETLALRAHRGYIVAADNLSNIPVWMSDELCRISTGGGSAKRKLYTDEEETIMKYKRPVIVGAIASVIGKSDLQDRSIGIELEPIPETERKPESILNAAFEKDRPLILGALLDAVSIGLKNEDAVKLDRLPRMADFYRFAVAAESAFTERGAFAKAFGRYKQGQMANAIESDYVASAIMELLEYDDEFTGTMSDLLQEVRAILDDDDRLPRNFPASVQAFSAKVKESMPILRAAGVEREPGRQRKREFSLSLRKTT